ncbi:MULTISPECIES: YgzB family protein [Brevibacillus]|uniref:Uncharacterized protein n=1 Tax=Brevibacillus invocatus TaxID=173959 RepID=A0A3M8BVG0_9BACL|nr:MULTISPECIES: YgzB family protein [Brevibacillus]EAM1016506.1 hypothetical protein [Salmonella enterica]MCM3082141.1 YgzB family protein [Brevibacillus invocatus]MCM3432556.1 YgzB family protein [Brevibacillus invocatus]MDH4616393.1 YgzB family protein [Brevibacillus sp. AY1]RNB67027.1 hypothetical protein EDM52_22995 [Brevibacillus invocatus]
MKKTERLSKIKRMRTWGNWSMVIGLLLMYTGYAFFAGYLDFIPLLGPLLKGSHIFMTLLLIIGFLLTMASTVLFMISGMVSTSAPQVSCPSCQKVTKMLGKDDACMFCGQPLRLEDEQPQNQT